jgi:hypothetical protein
MGEKIPMKFRSALRSIVVTAAAGTLAAGAVLVAVSDGNTAATPESDLVTASCYLDPYGSWFCYTPRPRNIL